MDRGDAYATYVKPQLMARLRAVGMDVEYHRARGDRIWYRDAEGNEIEVLDLVGGFGASLIGHNHPEILALSRSLADEERPFHAQASLHGEAGVLAERLSHRVQRSTGKEYVVTLANTGTEAIEAALKHAEMERRERAEAVLAKLHRQRDEIRLRLLEQTATLPKALFKEAARRFGVAEVPTFEELFARLSRQALELAELRPVFLALEGAFHGKTIGSVQLTYTLDFRATWSGMGPRSVFLPPGDQEALDQVVAEATVPYLTLALDADGVVRFVQRQFVNVGAAFAEPIQGEGGVREVSADYLAALRRKADEGGFPLVFDEIQTGMGRTGTFLASEPSGVVADYYTLAKTLSGGLAKISALLVDRARYLPEFGMVHTSTYAEDHHSSAIANRALDIIERDDDAVLAACREKGAWFLERLNALRDRYPEQLRDVRGRGLMIGVELAPQPRSTSPLLRVLSEQDRLGQFLAGHFLHEEGIRVTTTLSANSTIRVQPSAFVALDDLQRFCGALERVLATLRNADGFRAARFVVGRARQEAPPAPGRAFHLPPVPPGQTHVGFLGHFLEPGALRDWDPTLGAFTDADCARFLAQTEGAIDPFVVGRTELRSALGHATSLTVIGIPFSPEQAMASLRSGDEWISDLIRRGQELARRMGCSLLGYGGYTSIITNNCRDAVGPDLAVTSGNSLTAAAALEAARMTAERLGLERRVLGVVGAAGNIGMVLSEVASDSVDEIVLVGRGPASRRLRRVVQRVYASALDRAERGHREGIAAAMAPFVGQGDADLAERVEAALGSRAPVRIAPDLSALRACNMVLSATNAPEPVIHAEHVGEGPVVLIDVAVPTDVSPDVQRLRPRAVVLRGGMVHAPLEQSLEVDAMALRPGELYGCMAETLLLGLAGLRENFSCGPLSAPRVRRILDLARMHGFSIAENPA